MPDSQKMVTHALIGLDDGVPFGFGAVSGRFTVEAAETAVGSSPPGCRRFRQTLAALLHRHNREDEYTYVVAGTIGESVPRLCERFGLSFPELRR